MEMYIDGASPYTRIEVNDEEAKALSAVCQTCRGLCCTHFGLPGAVMAEDEAGKPRVDYEGWAAKCKTLPDAMENIEFGKTHWSMVPYPDHTHRDHCFVCSALNPETHLCDDYAKRPSICSGFICASAWYRGMPPSLSYNTMTAQTKGMPFEGVEPEQVPQPLWITSVLPRIEAEREAGDGLARGERRRWQDRTESEDQVKAEPMELSEAALLKLEELVASGDL